MSKFEELRKYHFKINRFDVQKDSKDDKYIKDGDGKILFNHCANYLFGELDGYEKTEKNIKVNIEKYKASQTYKISKLKHTSIFLVKYYLILLKKQYKILG